MQSTTSVLEGEELMRRDKRGRVWTKPERREALLDEFGKSGLSGAEFARLSGVKYSTLQNWLQQRRSRGPGRCGCWKPWSKVEARWKPPLEGAWADC